MSSTIPEVMEITNELYQSISVKKIQGRYITNEELENVLRQFSDDFAAHRTGLSVEEKPIHVISIGQGGTKVLMWSQMHGNESTTTKAVLDLLSFFNGRTSLAKNILSHCTISLVPILNPDGAAAYTRVNANKVDLNRDARELSQPESILLRQVYDSLQPDYCFNLHDQRTIFNVGNSAKPATISFLAPAADAEKSATKSRRISMQLIALMNKSLQSKIPGRIGRYDDTFNANCVGDTFQMLGTPTVLIEAGHSPGDYSRDQTRKYVFMAILEGLKGIAGQRVVNQQVNEYREIPENDKRFFDILIHNPGFLNPAYKKGESIGILYKEVLEEKKIVFDPYIEASGKLSDKFGHEVLDCKNAFDLNILKKRTTVHKLII